MVWIDLSSIFFMLLFYFVLVRGIGDMSEELLYLTERLLHYNEIFLKNYLEGRETGMTPDFHHVIKPFADEVKEVNVNWNEAMKKWLPLAKNTKHLHLNQIDTASAHIDQLSVQSFFPETSKSRFLNIHRTVEYILTEVIKELNK